MTYYAGRHYHLVDNAGVETERKFYTAGNTQIAVRTITDSQNTLTWVLSDHLGSTSVTANADGTLKSEVKYTAFGEIRSSSGTTDTPYQYTGQLSQMEEIGLYYFVARFYDPATAHFASADTLVPEPNSPLAWDRYSYTENNPIRYIDPSGHMRLRDGSQSSDDPWLGNFVNGVMKNAVSPMLSVNARLLGNMLLPGHVERQIVGSVLGYGRNDAAYGSFWPIVPVNNTQVTRSMLQYPTTTLKGSALNCLVNDPNVNNVTDDIKDFARNDPSYGKSGFRFDYQSNLNTDPNRRGLSDNQLYFGDPNRVTAFFQPATWEVRNVIYSASVDVTKKGEISVTYRIEDQFDLRPDWEHRAWYYNVIGSFASAVYHDFLGGNDQMMTIAEWQVDINP